MSDEKNKGKALNALKKKFNSGGRVNARRGGRRGPEDELGVAVKKPPQTAKTSAPKRSTQTAKTSAPKKPTGFQQLSSGTQTSASKKPTKTSGIPEQNITYARKNRGLREPLQQFRRPSGATGRIDERLELGQRPTNIPGAKSYKESGGTEANFSPISDIENPEYSEADLKSGKQPSNNLKDRKNGTPSISPMSPREQMGYNSVESKEGLTPRRGENSRRIPAGDANNIKSLLSEQMGISGKTDKSFDASKATPVQLKALRKNQEEAQAVTSSQEYQGLLEEYNRTKGDPKIQAQLQQQLAPFQEQQAAIMGTQSTQRTANVQQAQNAGQAVTSGINTSGIDVDVDLSGMPDRVVLAVVVMLVVMLVVIVVKLKMK